MKFLFPFVFTASLCAMMINTPILLAQNKRIIVGRENDTTFHTALKEREDNRTRFVEHVDSLFNEGRYDDLIQYTNWKIEHLDNSWEARQVMMAAFYFKGNHAASDELFNELVHAEGLPNTPFEMNSSDIIAVVKYFEVEVNRKKLYEHIFQKYRVQNHPQTQLGLQILEQYLNDQWIRRSNIKQEHFNLNFEKENQQLLDQQFALYMSRGRLLSPEEIGSSIFYHQFLLLCHEHDMVRRDFYLPMVQAAVKAGYCTIEREINFILRTEQMKRGKDFFDNYNQIIAEVSSKYGVKDFFYTIY